MKTEVTVAGVLVVFCLKFIVHPQQFLEKKTTPCVADFFVSEESLVSNLIKYLVHKKYTVFFGENIYR